MLTQINKPKVSNLWFKMPKHLITGTTLTPMISPQFKQEICGSLCSKSTIQRTSHLLFLLRTDQIPIFKMLQAQLGTKTQWEWSLWNRWALNIVERVNKAQSYLISSRPSLPMNLKPRAVFQPTKGLLPIFLIPQLTFTSSKLSMKLSFKKWGGLFKCLNLTTILMTLQKN